MEGVISLERSVPGWVRRVTADY